MKIEIREGFTELEVLIKCCKITEKVKNIESYLLHGFKEKLSATQNGTIHLIDRQDIFYFESVDRQTFLYTADEVYEISLKLYEIENLLAASGFFRNSKSQILNIAKIESLRPDFGGRLELVMKNGEQAVVSRQYAKLLKERLRLK